MEKIIDEFYDILFYQFSLIASTKDAVLEFYV